MVETPDNKEPHAPSKCSCGRHLTDVPKQIIERRQVFDLTQPKLEVTEHQLQSCICPDCQSLQVGKFPESVPARV